MVDRVMSSGQATGGIGTRPWVMSNVSSIARNTVSRLDDHDELFDTSGATLDDDLLAMLAVGHLPEDE